MSNKRELRFNGRELRAAADSPQISGYASVFNQPTPIADFMEVVLPGAFRRSLAAQADVTALINHSDDRVLGRTTSGTLTLREDSIGLYFECELPPTQEAKDLRTLIQRGDISQCSFGFVPVVQNWIVDAGGVLRRELADVELYDISVVTRGAYPTTSVSARSLGSPITPVAAPLMHKGVAVAQLSDEAFTDLARIRIALAK